MLFKYLTEAERDTLYERCPEIWAKLFEIEQIERMLIYGDEKSLHLARGFVGNLVHDPVTMKMNKAAERQRKKAEKTAAKK